MLLAVSALALDPDRDLSQYTCRQWTRQNGFPGNSINAITQTQDGFLWLGTKSGLIRYDGVEFKAFPFPEGRFYRSQAINSLRSTADGSLWFGIDGGAFGSYRPNRGFLTVTNEPWVNPSMGVTALLPGSDGSLWVGLVLSTIRRAQDGTVETVAGGDGCISLFEDSRHRVWLGTIKPELYCWEAGKTRRVPGSQFTNEWSYSMAEDAKGRLWVGTQSGLRCYDGSMESNTAPPLVGYKVTRVLADAHGIVWAGTEGSGLFRWKGDEVTSLQKSDGLADNHVTALFEDRDGNLWVGTRGGLSVLSDVKLPIFSASEGLSKGAYHAVCASTNGGWWASGESGISHYDGQRATNYSTEAGLASVWVKQVLESKDGDLYLVNGNRDVEIFHDGKVVARHNHLNHWPTAIAEDSQSVLVTFDNELFRVNRRGVTPYDMGSNAPSLPWIWNMAVAKDDSILLAGAGGLFHIKGAECERWGAEDGLPGDIFYAYEDRQGSLWVGSGEGLSRIRGREVQSWGREEGLFDTYIRGVTEDNQDRLWLWSGRGIFRVSKKNLQDQAEKRAPKVECVPYDGLDAVKTIEIPDAEYSFCRTTDGRIWAPGAEGLVMIDPDRMGRKTAPLSLHVQLARIDGRDYDCTRPATAPPGKGEVEVQYTAPVFVGAEKLQFRYRLEGYRPEWVEAGNRRTAFFANLKPGPYKFTVQARTPEGDWEQSGDAFAFALRPHFYQSTLCYLLGGGAVLLGLLGIYTYRVQHLHRKHLALEIARDELEAQVQSRTAELKERKLSLEKEVEERKRVQSEFERVHREMLAISRLAGMAEVATSVLHNVGNVLNSVNVSTALLTQRVKRSKVGAVRRVAELLTEHREDLPAFLSCDPKGRQLPSYVMALSGELAGEHAETSQELGELNKNLDHLSNIVAMQQSFATVAGVSTLEKVEALVEDSVRLNESSLARHQIVLTRKIEPGLPDIAVDRHKVLQILVNLLQNAKRACEESAEAGKCITVSAVKAGAFIRLAVADNGVGIPPENLTRIFSYAFTTRKGGHGFGLHGGALAAKELGGELRVHSAGPGRGATFTLDLPLLVPARKQTGKLPVVGAEV